MDLGEAILDFKISITRVQMVKNYTKFSIGLRYIVRFENILWQNIFLNGSKILIMVDIGFKHIAHPLTK